MNCQLQWLFILQCLVVLSAALATVDVCIVGDSTLQMFAAMWDACETTPTLPCAFKTVDGGIYHVQHYKGSTFYRKTKIVRSLCYDNATAMFLDFHSFDWLLMARDFWRARGREVSCRRTITNFHHHAITYFPHPRTADSVANMMRETETALQSSLGATAPIAWLLPTLPLDNNPEFPQTLRGVTETSILMSASGAETIATLQLLTARLQQIHRDFFFDRMHVDRAKLRNDSFTVLAIQGFLAQEFKRAAATRIV